MAGRGVLKASVSAVAIAGMITPPGLAASAAPASVRASPALDVRMAQNPDFSRLEFRWAGAVKASSRREGQVLTVRFNRLADPDISQLKVFPPKGVKSVEMRRTAGGLDFVLTLADDVDAKVGQADGATFVNVFARKAPEAPKAAEAAVQAAPAAQVLTETERPSATPDGGVVHMAAEVNGAEVVLRFPWKAPLGAAVFRRAGAIWVVFDNKATIDVSHAPRGVPQFTSIQAMPGGEGYSAIRINAPADTQATAINDGSTWTIALGSISAMAPSPIKLARDQEQASATLSAVMAGATKVVWLDDPTVGDRLAVVTALGPAKGLASRREYVEMAFLPSAQGLAIEPYAGDLGVTSDGDIVRIGRPKGLSLSPSAAAAVKVAAQEGAPQPASMPAVVDFDNWSRTTGGFYARYDALQDAAAEESNHDGDKTGHASVKARMALARFLAGSELSYEAIGVLNLVGRTQQTMMGDPEFRGLRGAAKVMAGRYKEAEADFSVPILTDDPSSALWRGYIAAQQGDWTGARQQFAKGQQALSMFNPKWRARFARANAEAALALGDLGAAQSSLQDALETRLDPAEELAVRLTQAKLFEAQNDKSRAVAVFDAIARSGVDQLASAAILHSTQIKLALNQVTPLQAANVYDGLRYRWRGDATELETIRALGQLYLSLGRYREALEALRSAGQRLPDLPEATGLQADLGTAFRALFLDGQADGLQPIQALALFYDFKELTPIGPDGDLMVRKMAKRLVDVDLLPQAAELLKYQADNRLDGVARAQVSTDLAMIYLMDRKPEDALAAINGSRTTLLPAALNADRRIIQARALSQLGRLDAALEIIEQDKSADAGDVRAEIAWKQRAWPAAGAAFEKGLGERWKMVDQPLSGDEEAKLLRSAIAFSLAGDEGSLNRLKARFGGFVDHARNPEALKVALYGVADGQVSAAGFNQVAADNDAFAGWVAKMKQRFRDRPAPKGAPITRRADAGPAPGAAPAAA